MVRKATVLAVECFECKIPLRRLTGSESDIAFCPSCGAINDYKEVVKNTSGLIGGAITKEELKQLRREAGLPDE